MILLNISKFIMCSNIEGPGPRFVLFLQGCNIGCKNCSNQEMLPLKEKLLIEPKVLMKQILVAKEKYSIQGITLLGGEPFLQPKGVRELVKLCKKNSLDVICFTGYIYNELIKQYKWINKYIDILIDGPFIWNKLDIKRRLIGSTNQIVYKLSDKFKNCNYFEEPHTQIEIQMFKDRININGDGTAFDSLNGFKFDINNLKKET